jgi:hypothetical protein
MRHILIIIATLFSLSVSFGQSLIRQENETVEMFASRLKPDSTEIAHTVIETLELDTTKRVIIAFYKKTIHEVKQMATYIDHSQYDIILGYMFMPTSENNYERILIDTIPPDGGDPEIISIFFANADKDKNNELTVLCKYEQRHYDYDGEFYETYIFDYFKDKKKFNYLSKLSETFWGCECGWRNGKTQKAKYKTANDVKAKLKKLGFN